MKIKINKVIINNYAKEDKNIVVNIKSLIGNQSDLPIRNNAISRKDLSQKIKMDFESALLDVLSSLEHPEHT